MANREVEQVGMVMYCSSELLFCWISPPPNPGMGSQWWKSGIGGTLGCWCLRRGHFVPPEHQASRALHKNHIRSHLLPGPPVLWLILSLPWESQAEPKIAKRNVSKCFPFHPFCLIEAEIPSPPAGALSEYSAQYEIPAQNPPERLLSTVL